MIVILSKENKKNIKFDSNKKEGNAMKLFRSVCGALAITCAVTLSLFSVNDSNAALLTNTEITIGDFFASFPTNVMYYSDSFDFSPSTYPFDGTLDTGVWTDGEGNYAYTYKINLHSASSDYISGLSIDFGNHLIPWDFGDGETTSFWSNSFFGPIGPTEVNYSFGTVRWEFKDENGDPILAPYNITFEFGVVANAPPHIISANLFDSGTEASPLTTSPVPEPGTMMLLGSGLVGLAGWGRKKFKK
jgi:hypothetical protein